MSVTRLVVSSARIGLVAGLCVLAAACAMRPKPSADFGAVDTPFQPWVETDPGYTLFPGDAIELNVQSVRNLSQTLTVAPDGRLHPPYMSPLMAAGRSIDAVEADIRAALSRELRDPEVDVRPVDYGSQTVFVGGEVQNPGVYELQGQIGVMEAVFLAGGFRESAELSRVALIRRAPGGGAMTKVVDVEQGIENAVAADITRLKRFDVVYVPRSDIAQHNLNMRQFVRDSLPINFGLFYNLGGSNN